jgi:hypothetical protein
VHEDETTAPKRRHALEECVVRPPELPKRGVVLDQEVLHGSDVEFPAKNAQDARFARIEAQVVPSRFEKNATLVRTGTDLSTTLQFEHDHRVRDVCRG